MTKIVSIFLLFVVLSFLFTGSKDVSKFSANCVWSIEEHEAGDPTFFANDPPDVDNLESVVPFILANDPPDVDNLESVLIPSIV